MPGTPVPETADMGAADEGATGQPVWLAGMNVGGAWRIGATVHRTLGPWTPAIHALLDYLAPRTQHIPRVPGFDEQGREIEVAGLFDWDLAGPATPLMEWPISRGTVFRCGGISGMRPPRYASSGSAPHMTASIPQRSWMPPLAGSR
jgi:hypothetical protein